jgi:hypothetical protein
MGQYGTLEFRKRLTVTSDLLASEDEVPGKNLKNLDKCVGG